MTPTTRPLQIAPASPDGLAETLALVFSRFSEEDRAERIQAFLADARSEKGATSEVLAARHHQRLVGAVAWQVQIGRTAVLWLPRAVDGEPAATLQKLMDTALEALATKGVKVVQTLLESLAKEDDALLHAGGFHPLADLLYLVSQEESFPQTEPSGPLEFEPYCPANHDRLAGLVEATYQGTLDCPALDGIRDMEDILAGYRASGVFRRNLWTIVRHQDRDIGCLLLADHPEHDNCELVYMGLVVPVRGNHWGIDVTRHAQWTARRLGRSRLVLAVDAANLPARNMYAAVGFRGLARRSVHIKVLDGGK